MTLPRPATIPDDRSPPREVPLWSPWRGGVETGAPAHHEIAQLLDRRLDTGLRKPMRAEALVMTAGMGVAVLAAATIALWNLHWAFRWVPMIPAMAICYAAAYWLSRRRGRHEIRALLLARGHCASCGYTLADLPPAPDGLTTCPECSAAWRLPPRLPPP